MKTIDELIELHYIAQSANPMTNNLFEFPVLQIIAQPLDYFLMKYDGKT